MIRDSVTHKEPFKGLFNEIQDLFSSFARALALRTKSPLSLQKTRISPVSRQAGTQIYSTFFFALPQNSFFLLLIIYCNPKKNTFAQYVCCTQKNIFTPHVNWTPKNKHGY